MIIETPQYFLPKKDLNYFFTWFWLTYNPYQNNPSHSQNLKELILRILPLAPLPAGNQPSFFFTLDGEQELPQQPLTIDLIKFSQYVLNRNNDMVRVEEDIIPKCDGWWFKAPEIWYSLMTVIIYFEIFKILD